MNLTREIPVLQKQLHVVFSWRAGEHSEPETISDKLDAEIIQRNIHTFCTSSPCWAESLAVISIKLSENDIKVPSPMFHAARISYFWINYASDKRINIDMNITSGEQLWEWCRVVSWVWHNSLQITIITDIILSLYLQSLSSARNHINPNKVVTCLRQS